MGKVKADERLIEIVQKLEKIEDEMWNILNDIRGTIANFRKMKEIIEENIARWTEREEKLRKLYSEAYNLRFKTTHKNVLQVILFDEDLEKINQGETLELQYHNCSVLIKKE